MSTVSESRQQQLSPGLAIKVPCKAATTGPVLLTGEQTIDGVVCVTGDRVLVWLQANPIDNGIWQVSTGAWSRVPDFDGTRDATQGTLVIVNEGSSLGRFYRLTTTDDPVVFGTSLITFELSAQLPIAVGSLIQIVDSIAALKALAVPVTAQTYFVRGYYAAGDGGGGMFRYNAADASADNGGTIIAPNVGAGRWDRIYDAGRLNAKWFGAKGDGATNDTTALANWLATISNGGAGYLPGSSGPYMTDPQTITKSCMLFGDSGASGTIGSVLAARANQTSILKWAGAGFPVDLFGWGTENISLFGGAGITISDAAMIIQDCAVGRHKFLAITNVTGSAIRFKNAQDIHFVQPYIADCGNNAGAKPVINYDNTSSNNVNNIYWTDPHFESLAWTIMSGSGNNGDQIQIIGGKNENRTTCNGIVSGNLAYPLFDVSAGRFSIHDLTITATDLFGAPTIKLYGVAPQVTGLQIQNAGAAAQPIVSIDAGASAYVVRGNGGVGVSNGNNDASGILNNSTSEGYTEPFLLAGLGGAFTTRLANLDAVAPPVTRAQNNAGGTLAYGVGASINGVSLTFNTQDDAIPSVRLPMGYPKPVTVHFRVKSSADITMTLGVTTKASAATAITTGIAVLLASGFVDIQQTISPDLMKTNYAAYMLKETAGADTVTFDGGWIEYVGYSSGIPSGTAPYSTMTWAVGARMINITPVVGQPKAWSCTVAGTPGTWVSEGNL